jgi:hypothetical protein
MEVGSADKKIYWEITFSATFVIIPAQHQAVPPEPETIPWNASP